MQLPPRTVHMPKPSIFDTSGRESILISGSFPGNIQQPFPHVSSVQQLHPGVPQLWQLTQQGHIRPGSKWCRWFTLKLGRRIRKGLTNGVCRTILTFVASHSEDCQDWLYQPWQCTVNLRQHGCCFVAMLPGSCSTLSVYNSCLSHCFPLLF